MPWALYPGARGEIDDGIRAVVGQRIRRVRCAELLGDNTHWANRHIDAL